MNDATNEECAIAVDDNGRGSISVYRWEAGDLAIFYYDDDESRKAAAATAQEYAAARAKQYQCPVYIVDERTT